ncbi:WD40-repeat-containing domain protein [Calycina marina]|uniref:WD40-repeat-containing domain protein n=1 Tax=Calycina marina TaxID=1763456 RepID=A0A9P7Z6S8_9HELO|nr:WD40-repeat-containing domain protein [Calycina marina]
MEDANDVDVGGDMEGDDDGNADDDGNGDDDVDGDDDDNDEDDDDGGEDEEDFPERPQARRPSLNTNSSSDGGPVLIQMNDGPTSHPHPTLVRTSASPEELSPALRSPRTRLDVCSEALTASSYDIVPTMAAPQSTSINAITATPDMRYWYTGGSDCFIRKYDGAATINGKTLLTVAQRHPFVDSVVKAGVLMNYWDNEEPIMRSPGGGPDDHPLSPVYSLAVQSQSLWILSGLESGAINLYSGRHDEGKRIAHLIKHKSAVSVLTLARDERSVLSGSWDRSIFDWDLNTGQLKRTFEGSGSQISAIQVRPASTLPVPEESGDVQISTKDPTLVNGNNSRVNRAASLTNGHTVDDGTEDAPGSPSNDSLFGGSDGSLFGGDTAGTGAPSGGHFGDEDDEFSRAMNVDLGDPETDTQGDIAMTENNPQNLQNMSAVQPPTNGNQQSATDTKIELESQDVTSHTESGSESNAPVAETQDAVATSDSTFLAASIDGSLRVWDRRQPNPIARIPTRQGVPPWCMAACWSPDGNYIYAGRRNGTVEEFSLHKGLKAPERTFKFPMGSGAVSAVRAMPNGRHLICASHDILRLYDLKQSTDSKHSTVPFLIVPGPPRAGVISALHIDPTCKYMLSTAGNRGWEGNNTEVLIGYEIAIPS